MYLILLLILKATSGRANILKQRKCIDLHLKTSIRDWFIDYQSTLVSVAAYRGRNTVIIFIRYISKIDVNDIDMTWHFQSKQKHVKISWIAKLFFLNQLLLKCSKFKGRNHLNSVVSTYFKRYYKCILICQCFLDWSVRPLSNYWVHPVEYLKTFWKVLWLFGYFRVCGSSDNVEQCTGLQAFASNHSEEICVSGRAESTRQVKCNKLHFIQVGID